jgi:GT2 family glycosyltransferase
MIVKLHEPNKSIVANTIARHPLEIPDFFHAVIPIPSRCTLNFIDLFLNVDDQTKGSFCIDIVVNNKASRFNVPFKSLKKGTPLRLVLDAHPMVENSIGLFIKTESVKSPVSLWINEAGPCLVINADVLREINLKRSPLISVITPIYKSNLEYLKQAVQSVIDQVYTKWELCLIDDGSKDPSINAYLKKLNDPRIILKCCKENKGISEATNIGIQSATGEYLCFLDHDDLLTPNALLEVAEALNRSPRPKFIYTDEDKVTEDGSFTDAFFKPDWSYAMFLSQNYTCHLSVYETKIVKRLKGMRTGFEGSQDYDLALRVIKKIDEKEIKHIPVICYHWRKHDQSTSSDITQKPNAHISAMMALKEHLSGTGKHDATVSVGRYVGTYRVNYHVVHRRLINIIIPTRDNPVYLKTCIFSLLQSTYLSSHRFITIVDNNSKDKETLKLLDQYADMTNFRVLRYDKPFNYSAINNFAVSHSAADCHIFLNDDTEVITLDWIEQLMQHIGRDKVGAAGAKLLYSDNRIQHAGVIIGIGGVAGHSHKHMPDSVPGYFSRPHLIQNVSAVTGACLMISDAVFKEVGGFDETLPKAFNDIDLCLKVRKAGYKIVYNPYACLYHHESVSRGLDNHKEPEFAKAIALMQKRWNCKNFKDPYYNPNLTLVDENFSFRANIYE